MNNHNNNHKDGLGRKGILSLKLQDFIDKNIEPDKWRPVATMDVLRQRAQLLTDIRQFFATRQKKGAADDTDVREPLAELIRKTLQEISSGRQE